MAVVDQYVNSNISGNVVTKALKAIASGAQIKVMLETFEIAAADSDGSVYRVFKSVDPNLIPLAILVACDAITGGTDFGVGLYNENLGTVINKDAFRAGMDLSSAVASLNPKTALDGMSGVDIANMYKRIFEHAGHTVSNKKASYDIALTGDTVGTAAGTVTVAMLYLQG